MEPRPLEERVAAAAEAALRDEQRVSAIDVLMRIGYLHPAHLEYWKRGTVSCLEESAGVSADALARALGFFRQWVQSRSLRARAALYQGQSPWAQV